MTTPWHEDEAFWRHMATAIFSSKRRAKAPEEVEQILELVAVDPGATVLDLPCGPGRHVLEFARRGFAVIGVDITPAYLDEARRRADEDDLNVELICDDMRRFQREGAFDLALNLFSSFGYFEDIAEDEQVARNILHSLRPGGTLVMDMFGREVVARVFNKGSWEEDEDGGLLLEEREILASWSRSRTRWIYLKDGERYEHTFELRVYAADQLMDLLRRAGFTEVDAYGSFKGDPYDHEAQRLVVTARRA